MLWRSLTFLACLLAGGLAGLVVELEWQVYRGSLLGVLSGVLLWFFVDMSRAGRFMRYLRESGLGDYSQMGGVWGEAAVRVNRLLRDRDREQAELQHRLQDFLSALQASPSGVVLLDRDAHIEWCNQTACQHFGLNAQRDLSQTIGNLVRDPGFVRYLSSRDYQSSVVMPGRESSVSRPVVLSVQLNPYGEGRMLLLSRDITAMEQADAMRRDFVANVSHEIRTPLTVLAGFVETLQTLQLDEQERQYYLTLMAQQSDRMQTLVSDLLTLSRLEGSPPPGLDSWSALSQLVVQLRQDALALSQLICSGHGVPHDFVFEDRIEGEIAGNASELLSAMGNLVSNAIRYTPAGGRIVVNVLPLANGELEFSVADTGPGIAQEHLGRLTERFYRVDRSRSRETGGTGLGLAIVKHVAQRHGASLSIESTPGKGSTFRIRFPAERIRMGTQPG
jgi:two-component system phosphate regulon sensor histidine kinase PhoR